MKKLLSVTFLLLSFYLHGQNNLTGEYSDYFGNTLVFNKDSTFHHKYRFDLVGSWSIGTYKMIGDTIKLEIIPIYDTIIYDTETVVVLSYDSISESFPPEIAPLLNSVIQNHSPIPNKLFFKKNRLFEFDRNGKLITKKVSSFQGKKKVPPYYSIAKY